MQNALAAKAFIIAVITSASPVTVLAATTVQNGVTPDMPFSFDAAPGRLPKNVVPLDYILAITPDIAAHSVAGVETVKLQFRTSTDLIQLNSLNQVLADVRLDGKPVKRVDTSNEQQLTTITLNQPARVGVHTLTFNYQGVLESRPFGLFSQTFVKPDGSKDQIISSKFEATDARRMFPCWDEPAFRTTFTLTATVAAAWAAVSNMPVEKRVIKGDLATTTFARSPKMPTYLLEFTAGDLAQVSARVGKTILSVWAVRGQEKDGATALENSKQILADYNDYFGFPFPLPKLDSIATPGGFTGAMENWGAITYNDQLLLITPSSTLGNKQAVFSVEAHEMAHQWNGDLVTMGWWDDLWLNESFASWRASKETDMRYPSWQWKELQDGSKEDAMKADARLTSRPIRQHVNNELEARSAFDPDITYAKGEAILSMFEAFVGPDKFRAGVRRYMKAHSFSNATSADLWNAMNAVTHQDIGSVAADWTTKAGFPIVHASTSCDAGNNRTLTLTQKRFLLQGNDETVSGWQVPLKIRIGLAAAPTAVLLKQNGQQIAAGKCDQPISLNADVVGYYRVSYDSATQAMNAAHFTELPFGDRIALLDDLWAQSEAHGENLASYLDLAARMGSDLDERAWTQITDALSTIEYYERGTPGHDAFTAYARSVIKPLADRLGWGASADETPGIQRLRRTLLIDLDAWGDASVLPEARRRFDVFLKDRAAIAPDDQHMILGVVALHADQSTFDQLHQLAQSATNETDLRRYYTVLAEVRDPELAKQAAAIAVSQEIPEQASALRLQITSTLSDLHPAISWATFSEHVDILMQAYPQYAPMILSKSTPEIYWNTVPLDELEAWVKARIPAPMYPNLARGMEVARFKHNEKESLVKAADAFTAARGQQ